MSFQAYIVDEPLSHFSTLSLLLLSFQAYIVDDLRGLLVVRPDTLVSGTSIVSTLFCMRKAILNEKFKGLEGECYF